MKAVRYEAPAVDMLELGLIAFFCCIAAWMRFTTPRVRDAVFGYLILLAVIAFVVSLLTGQGPNSHYGPY